MMRGTGGSMTWLGELDSGEPFGPTIWHKNKNPHWVEVLCVVCPKGFEPLAF